MLHFTCDLCGKELYPNNGPRYVVKMEVFAASDPHELTDDDLDSDAIDQLSELLNQLDEGDSVSPPPSYKKLRYDLCPNCHRKFLRDPLNRETAPKFDFSEN